MSNIGERIFKIKSYYFGDERGSNKKFADVVGEKPNTVSNWFGRKDGIGDAVIDKILSTFPNVDKGWLVGGNGDMLTSTESPSLAQAIDNESDLKSALKKGIKLLPEVDFGNALLHGRVPSALEGGTDRRIQRGNLEAFQKVGRHPDRHHPERQGSACVPRGREHL